MAATGSVRTATVGTVGRSFLLIAAVALLAIQAIQSYLSLSDERSELSAAAETIAESASVATATPLWLLSGETLREVMRSYVSFAPVDRVVLYEMDRPWLAYDREAGLLGNPDSSAGRIELLELDTISDESAFATVTKPVIFDGERIGRVSVTINEAPIVAARRESLLRTGLIIVAEVIIVFVLMRLRGNQIFAAALNRENEQLQAEVSRRVTVEQTLRTMAFYDSLTGLPRPVALGEEVTLPVASQEAGVPERFILLMSIENLQELSAVLDADVVSEIVRVFATRLKAALPEEDEPVALRGSAFRFYVVTVAVDRDEIVALAEQILHSFREPLTIQNRQVRMRVRVGIAPFGPEDGFDEARRRSEISLRSLRERSSTRRIGFFDDTAQQRADRRVEVESAMSRGDFLEQLRIYFQPIVDMDTREPVGYEALVRWQHPEMGMVSPADFIPLAEENGIILDLGWFVLQKSLEMAARLGDQTPAGGTVPFVSVNVSPVQLMEADLPRHFADRLAEAGIPRERIKIEITETVLEETQDTFWRVADSFRELGLAIAIDDFGSGSSAFRRIHDFAFDTLKIDQHFVRNADFGSRSQTLFESITRLATTLSMMPIAEGIETEEHVRFVRDAGCGYGQGYLFGKPAPMEEYV